MRTYKDCFVEYCNWLVKTTGNSDYEYTAMVEEHGKINAHAIFYKNI